METKLKQGIKKVILLIIKKFETSKSDRMSGFRN